MENLELLIEHAKNASELLCMVERSPSPNEMPFEEPMVYGLIKGSDITIGRSFDPVDLSSIKRPAIDFQTTQTGGAETSFDYYYVSNSGSIESIIGNDTTASSSYLNSSFSFGNTSHSSQKQEFGNIEIIAVAKTDYGRWSLAPGYKLFDEAKKTLKENPEEFARIYGTRYVATQRKMDAVIAKIQIYSASSRVKRKFESTVNGGLGFSKLTAEFKSEFSKEITIASKQNRVLIESFAIGGAGTSSLEKLVYTASAGVDPYDGIADALKKFLATFDVTNAKPFLMNVASMRNFGLDEAVGIPWSWPRAKKLAELNSILKLLIYEKELGDKIKNGNHPLSRIADEELLNKLPPAVKKIETLIIRASDLHANCRTDPNPGSFNEHIQKTIHLPMAIHLYNQKPTPLFGGIAITDQLSTCNPLSFSQTTQCLELPPDQRLQFVQNLFPNAEHYQLSFDAIGFLPLESVVVELERKIGNKKIPSQTYFSGSKKQAFIRLSHSDATVGTLEYNLEEYVKSSPYFWVCHFDVILHLNDAANRTFTHRICKASLAGGQGKIVRRDYEYFPQTRSHEFLNWI